KNTKQSASLDTHTVSHAKLHRLRRVGPVAEPSAARDGRRRAPWMAGCAFCNGAYPSGPDTGYAAASMPPQYRRSTLLHPKAPQIEQPDQTNQPLSKPVRQVGLSEH